MTQFGCAAERVFRDHDQPPLRKLYPLHQTTPEFAKKTGKKRAITSSSVVSTLRSAAKKSTRRFLKVQSEDPVFVGNYFECVALVNSSMA